TGRKASTPPREVKSSAAGYLSRPVTSRRDFLGFLGALPALRRLRHGAPPAIEVRPSALFAQPDGRKNLVRIAVSGLDAPAARAQVIGRHGELIGTAGLLRLGEGLTLQGEVWVPLSEPTSYRVDLEVGRQQVARQTVRLVPPRRWTLYWLSSNHTDIGYTDLQERCLEIHRENLDAAVKHLATGPNPERALPLLPRALADENHLAGAEWTAYPQLYWWEGPDGSRVLHWRSHRYGDASRFGFDVGAEEMGRRLSDWLIGNPVFQSPEWPYDIALLYGAS